MHTPKAATVERFWSKVDRRESEAECWPWIGCKRTGGYGAFFAEGRHRIASRFSYALHHKIDPNDLRSDQFVCHRCDNPSCVNPSHLFLGSVMDNIMDARAKGRMKPSMPRIYNGYPNRVPWENVLAMRKEHRKGTKATVLARQFNCSVNQARRIVNGNGYGYPDMASIQRLGL